jgi:choline dehydrogenase-like flavoprotein
VARVDVVVVGAGTAGAVVAARLTGLGRSVLVLEAGPGRPGPSGLDPFAALAAPGRTWEGLVARRTATGPEEPYWQGRGVGGTSAVNGMMATWGRPADYNSWRLPGWTWRELQPAVRRVDAALPQYRPRRPGPVNRAFAAAAGAVGIDVARPWFTIARRRRVTVAEAYGVVARGDSVVDRVLLAGRRAAGVRLDSGEEIEASEVVVSAGALHTPVLLLRSGVDRPGIGASLQDHPAVRVVVHLAEADRVPDRRRLPFGVVGRRGDVQFVPMDYTDDLATGGITVALMQSHARGRVVLRQGEPEIRFEQLADERDRVALESALHLLERALPGAEIPAVDQLGDVFHAGGTCRMGEPTDPDAVVDPFGRVIGYEGLRVADASVLPILPAANPMLTCVLVGERLVERW